jgi:glycosyltransferase involved in cell wall biosynthesis
MLVPLFRRAGGLLTSNDRIGLNSEEASRVMAGDEQELAINGRFLTQPTTGVQRVARELTREIDHLVASGRIGLRLRLLCETGAKVDDLDLRATKVEFVRGGHGHWWEQVFLPRAARGARLLCFGNTAPIASLLGPRPVGVIIHDLSYRLYPEAYSRRYRLGHAMMLPLLLRRADPVITVSESERTALLDVTNRARDRIVVAQNGGWREDDTPPVPRPADRAQAGYLLYVGSFSRRKNFDSVLRAAIRLAREDGLHSVFAGSGGPILTPTTTDVPEDVRQKIRFVGQVEDVACLAALYSGARCLLLPSFYEASPLPPIEAMRFGCPVIVSDIPAMRERCAEAVEYCDPERFEDVVAAVRRVTRDPAHAARLVARGYRQVERFSWRRQAETVLAALGFATQSSDYFANAMRRKYRG